MITFEQASAIAKKELPTVTSYTEKDNAYIFVDENQKWDGEVVILKSSGKVVSYFEYVMEYGDKSIQVGGTKVSVR